MEKGNIWIKIDEKNKNIWSQNLMLLIINLNHLVFIECPTRYRWFHGRHNVPQKKAKHYSL